MTSVLDLPLDKQTARAQREGKTLSQWQADTKTRLLKMRESALASVKSGELKNLSQKAIDRFQKKMDSAVQ